jgi:hypothetical protein
MLTEITKKPTTWVIILLAGYSIFMTMLYLQQADVVTTQNKELTALKVDSTATKITVINQKETISKHEQEISSLTVKLDQANSSLSWYKKNWYKKTSTTTNADGSSTTTTDEGSNENGGASSSSSSTSTTIQTQVVIRDSTVVKHLTVYDTTRVTLQKDSIVYKEEYKKTEFLRKGRIYIGIGGSTSEKIDPSPELKAGFVYGFTKLSYIGVEASKSGLLDYSQGYRVGASVGFKLDF